MQQLVAELSCEDASHDARERVRAMCIAFARFGLRNPRHYELLALYRGPDAAEPPSGEEARRLLEEPLDALCRDCGADAGALETLRLGLWSLLHGYILLRTSRPDENWSDAVLERGIDALLRNGTNESAYVVKQAKNGEFYFNIVATNGETLSSSELYLTKSNATRAAKTARTLVTRIAEPVRRRKASSRLSAPVCSFNSLGEPMATMRPWSMIAIRWATFSASSM